MCVPRLCVKAHCYCLHASVDLCQQARYKFDANQIPWPRSQARDNVKFLSTLERHFKAISSGPLPAIADCLLPLMSALRMVWIMSRHYGGWRRGASKPARGSAGGCIPWRVSIHTWLQ